MKRSEPDWAWPEGLAHRVPCNEALGDHESIQVAAFDVFDSVAPAVYTGPYTVGMLGIINGLFGIGPDGWGYIIGHTDDDGQFVKFEYRPPRKPEVVKNHELAPVCRENGDEG